MVVGPRRSNGRPRAKGFCGVRMNFRKPKWISRRKALRVPSGDHSSYDEVPPSYASSESGFEGLPEIIASFNPDEFNPGDLLKRYHERRSRERRSGAPSPDFVVEEEHHEGSGTTNKNKVSLPSYQA